MDRIRVAEVALDPRSGGAESIYTYRADASSHIGQARFVPIGNRSTLGFVVDVFDASEEDLGFSFESLKELGDSIDNLSLPESVVSLAKFVAHEYLCPLSVALSAATPPGAQDRVVSGWTVEAPPEDFSLSAEAGPKLTTAQQEALRTLHDSNGSISESATHKLPPAQLKVLSQLGALGLVRRSLRIQPFQERRRTAEYLALSSDHDAIERFLAKEGVKKPAQALTLMRLQGAENSFFSVGEVKALAGVTETTVKSLLASGLLQRVDPELQRGKKPPKPNQYQQLAIDAVAESIGRGEPKSFLLYGVTGSGKTEVYLRLAQETLRHGRQVLYLVPEIALATQAISQLRERFGHSVTILHSELPPGERLQNWMSVREGKSSVVLGARSALFAPLNNLGLVILDEEHEATYKQESSPRYHSKRTAEFLSSYHRCPLVLGSATPSIESFREAEAEKITLLSLPIRAASAQLPEVHIVDLSAGFRSGRPAILSDELQAKLFGTVSRKEQAILFLNRRAYAPFVICRDCGHQMICPRCSVSLSFHRRAGLLRCHHCDYRIRVPDTCPMCSGTRLNPFGIGTEKVEEAVANLLPDARVARLDRDIAKKKGALESVLASFRSGHLDVLVGTQMVAKGLDFPNVTLVGVVAADISLNIPDFRSSERTFQLLSQVAGRAGRGSMPGEVIIQTFNPEHPAVVTAKNHDFLSFYEQLCAERETAGYPPFRRLVNIVFSSESLDAVTEASAEASSLIAPALSLGSEILGPANCPLERLNSRWRRHLLIKLDDQCDPAAIGSALFGWKPKGIQTIIDVDPYSLM